MFSWYWNKVFGHVLWLTAVGLITVWFHPSHCVSLYSCVDTQRGSRSPFRFTLEQLTTDQSGHILSIRYTGTELYLYSKSHLLLSHVNSRGTQHTVYSSSDHCGFNHCVTHRQLLLVLVQEMSCTSCSQCSLIWMRTSASCRKCKIFEYDCTIEQQKSIHLNSR